MWLIGAAVAFLLLFKGKSLANPLSNSGNMTISPAQLQLTADTETFQPNTYSDGVDSSGNQAYSIGYGHQLTPGESYPNGISQADALQLLNSDMGNVIDAINNYGLSLTQGQFDALADFGYSAGVGALAKAIKLFPAGVPDYFLQYVYWHPNGPGTDAVFSQNLQDRRNVEVQTWNS